MKKEPLQHWSNYWSSGVQTSLPQDFQNNYDGEIYTFWSDVVSTLSDGARVLDLCTGNGAVALLLAEAAIKQNKRLNITAVDLSQINIQAINANHPKNVLSMIEFISDCPIESINKKINKAQDLIVSQYGLEYSHIPKTAKAVAKVINKGGRLVFIAHGKYSAIFDYMTTEDEIYDWLEKIGILSLFTKLATQGMTREEFQLKTQKITSTHQPKQQFHQHPLFQSWLNLIRKFQPLTGLQLLQQKASLNHFLQQHQYARQRAKDMLNVSEKVKKKNWLDPIADEGFELLDQGQIKYKNQHLAGDWFKYKLNN